MNSQDDLKAWAGETTLGRRIFNYNFRMFGQEVKGWVVLKAVTMHEDRALTEKTYLWQSKEAPDRQMIRVNVAELADWRAAQKHLQEMLGQCMRPDLPRGTGKLAELGDIEFVARAPLSDIPAAIHFARGNIAVSVNSVGQVAIDVSDIAGTVDQLLSESPARVPSLRALAKTEAPKTIQVRGKEGASLVKDLKKFRDLWLKVIVPDGELRRKGDALVYVSPEAGKKAVQIFSIRPRARTTSARK
ncbi:MAG: hypothetical protein EHM23_23455 [Acidobacteria bacterium]|nr:MAG: hypothetical protein EHM23_23455 [Acidobacteriota bacterium]